MNSHHPALTFFSILPISCHLVLLLGFVLLEHVKANLICHAILAYKYLSVSHSLKT